MEALPRPLIAAATMFAGIFALRLEIQAPESAGICLLFIAPIALLTLSYGFESGLVGAAIGVVLLVIRTQVEPVHVDGLFFVTRFFVFVSVPLVIALARRESAARSAGPGVGAETTGPRARERKASEPRRLTRREVEVLGLVAAGHTNAQIAEVLFLSVRTVESHRASLLRKLGRPTREELVAHARERGLVPMG